ncbi:uncharacterized protein BO97DRAFT_457555 [Aspergillus homomorphus CBS 101889]|uniref:Small secreted protein n=1 Tax=Aspergillus homomorphus (strain CBS 101889) TaxID=1450537 RepID=A0A395HP45_ASPHC|nr:hypothetical protein BO97DRAFT_457555 [Aspergillus homomorphus CBS 101889]RAL09732.1 hypothetical protein BO97DRAFT_457555 [Aspergillus homomorphus CBS 101889]
MGAITTFLTSILLTTTTITTTTAIATQNTTTTTTTFPNTLNITTLTAHNNHSVLECWALQPGYAQTTEPGVAGNAILNLGPIANNASNILIPPSYDGGQHNAPALQWVIFLSGLAHITLPHSDDEAWVSGGKDGMILALDTEDVSTDGHATTYPSGEVTFAVEVPLREVPGHTVLHAGACGVGEMGV